MCVCVCVCLCVEMAGGLAEIRMLSKSLVLLCVNILAAFHGMEREGEREMNHWLISCCVRVFMRLRTHEYVCAPAYCQSCNNVPVCV